ncbi:MAG TPA: hypothetical protein DD734_10880 [Firmicutes bacterium]|nr:hypothetical protein [Bacillota bacterium]
MLPGDNNDKLKRSGINTQAKRVFVQRWLELIYFQTIDSHSVKLLNSNGVLLELTNVIESTLKNEIGSIHLTAVWEEAREIIASDKILDKYELSLKSSLLKLLGKCPGAQKTDELEHVLHKLAPLKKILETGYFAWLLNSLDSALAKNDSDMVYYLTGILASELSYRRNPESLFLMGVRLKKDGFTDSAWNSFKCQIQPGSQVMGVFCPFSGQPKTLKQFENKLSIALIPKNEVINRNPCIEDLLNDNPVLMSSYYLFVATEAEDYQTAAFQAYDVFNEAIDVINLFQRDKIHIKNHLIVENHSVPNAIKQITGPSGPQRIQSSLGGGNSLPIIIQYLNNTNADERIITRLKSVIQYIRLSDTAHSQATRFINLWVALESLVRQQGNIIDNIKQYVSAILCNRYSYLLLRNFLEDSNRCRISLEPLIGNGTKSQLVYNLLTVIQNSPSQLITACSEHDALAIRAQELVSDLVTGTNAARLIASHSKRLQWNLVRLYRIRNSIIHAGETPNFIVPCTRHLNNYIFATLTNIIYRLSKHKINSIAGVLGMHYSNHLLTIEELRRQTHYDPKILLDGPLFGRM